MSYKSAKQVKMIKAVLENKLKNIVQSVDSRILKLSYEKEVKNEVELNDPKKLLPKKK